MAGANSIGALSTNLWVSWSRQYRRGRALTPPDHFSATVPPLSSYGGSTPMRRWSESGLPPLVNVRSGYSTDSRVKNQPCTRPIDLYAIVPPPDDYAGHPGCDEFATAYGVDYGPCAKSTIRIHLWLSLAARYPPNPFFCHRIPGLGSQFDEILAAGRLAPSSA